MSLEQIEQKISLERFQRMIQIILDESQRLREENEELKRKLEKYTNEH